MKKLLILMLSLAIPAAIIAQPDVVSAFNSNKDGDYVKAAEYIESAKDNPKANSKEKYWRYRGEIYLNIANDPALFQSYPDALDKAFESWSKAKELDPKGTYEMEIKRGLVLTMNKALQLGIDNYNTQNYEYAARFFAMSNAVTSSAFDSTFTMALYNAGLSYEKAGNIDKAIEYYTLSANEGYMVPDIYVIMVNLLSNADRTDEALLLAQSAREKYPRNKGLILEELNIYLRQGKLEAALTNLDAAIETDPKNEILIFSKGSVLDNLGRQEEARVAYEQALDINPKYYDALYNLGAMYFNKGAEKVNQANEVPPKQQKLYNDLMNEAKGFFEQAKPIFELALEVNPTDVSTARSLRDIYARTGEDEKLKNMSIIIDGK
jgi:tetratricopeptide (TPR) repeat protein